MIIAHATLFTLSLDVRTKLQIHIDGASIKVEAYRFTPSVDHEDLPITVEQDGLALRLTPTLPATDPVEAAR